MATPLRSSVALDALLAPVVGGLCGLTLIFVLGSFTLAVVNAGQRGVTSCTSEDVATDLDVNSWWGVALALVGNVVNAVGISVEKSAHRRSGLYIYTLRWWVGFLLVAAGETANAVAYGLAPINVVAPLGAITIVVIDVIAFCGFGEAVRPLNVCGALLIVLGVVASTLVTPPTTTLYVASTLLTPDVLLSTRSVLLYACLAMYILFCVLMTTLLSRRHVLVLASMAAALSSITIVASRGFFSMLTLVGRDCAGELCSVAHRPACFETVGNWSFWALFGVILVSAIVTNGIVEQQALALYPQSLFVPVHFGVGTLFYIASGAIVYSDFDVFTRTDVAFFATGLPLILLGVVLVTGCHSASDLDAQS